MRKFSELSVGEMFHYMGRLLLKVESKTIKAFRNGCKIDVTINSIECAVKKKDGGAWYFESDDIVQIVN